MLGDTQTEPESSEAKPRGSVADDAAVVQDASDAHARHAETLVAVTLPEGSKQDTQAEPNSVVESSIEAPAQAVAERADHARQADDTNLPASAGIDVDELKAAEIATSKLTSEAKPDDFKASAADHNGANADKADSQTISARADGVEMSMDELIAEGATAEPSVSGQGGLEAGAK